MADSVKDSIFAVGVDLYEKGLLSPRSGGGADSKDGVEDILEDFDAAFAVVRRVVQDVSALFVAQVDENAGAGGFSLQCDGHQTDLERVAITRTDEAKELRLLFGGKVDRHGFG